MGGAPYVLQLLKILQPLATTTETTVRQSAVSSMVLLMSRVTVTLGPGMPATAADKLAVEWAEMKNLIMQLSGRHA
jgi:hypothetical protein